jgi:hypothetical protein
LSEDVFEPLDEVSALVGTESVDVKGESVVVGKLSVVGMTESVAGSEVSVAVGSPAAVAVPPTGAL